MLSFYLKPSGDSPKIHTFKLGTFDEAMSDKTTHPYLVFLTLLLIIFMGWFYLNIVSFKYWTADMLYASGKGEESKLMQAIALAPYRDDYKLELSKSYFAQAKTILKKSQDERNEEELKRNIDLSLEWGKMAMKTNLNDVAARENLGIIYRELSPYVSNSEDFALIYFKEAWKLEPGNPVLPAEIGKLDLKLNKVDEAIRFFEESLNLKNDYHEAEFYIAKAYGLNGRENDALQYLVKLSTIYNDPEIYFEAGRIYYNQGFSENAIKYFEKSLSIVPDHANSLYSLGLAYESQGNDEKALEYFKKTLKLNPENEELIKRVEVLEK